MTYTKNTGKNPEDTINLLVTLDENYIKYLKVMLSSLIHSNPEKFFDVYFLYSSINDKSFDEVRRILMDKGNVIPVKADEIALDKAPVTDRYPQEMYYRIFAARYLPETLKRVLYLDPDIVVIGSIDELYHTPLGKNYFAAATHVGKILHVLNEARLNLDEQDPYINSGVMLMNLEILRKEQDFNAVYDYIEEKKDVLFLPDQDVISGLYGSKIIKLNPSIYNMTERLFAKQFLVQKDALSWVRENTRIIHYIGKNKPWKSNYTGSLNVFYHEAKGYLEGWLDGTSRLFSR